MKKKILITAGPTREYIDPVRYISNASSGKMGYSLASASKKLGYDVTLISGPVDIDPPNNVNLVKVETAKEMHKACLKHFKSANVIIMTAAISDFRPISKSKTKIKRSNKPKSIKLVPSVDVLKDLSKKLKSDQILVGFALETDSLIDNARKKLKDKKCDWIVANKSNVIGSDSNKVWLISKEGRKISIPRMKKEDLAVIIMSYIV